MIKLKIANEPNHFLILNSQPANKLDVLQSLKVHDILVKREVHSGPVQKGPFYSWLFEGNGEEPTALWRVLHPQRWGDDSEDADSETVFQMLQSFVRNASAQDLEDLLKFITGSHTSSSATLPYRVSVSCHESDSFFASCCLLQLKLPKYFTNYAEFELPLRVVLEGKGSSFTTAWAFYYRWRLNNGVIEWKTDTQAFSNYSHL